MTISALPLSGASALGTASADKAGSRLTETAQQFEAVFLRQMLAAARKSDFGGEDLFGGQGMDTFREMQDAQFADIAAKTGAIGMADMIEAHLARFAGQEG